MKTRNNPLHIWVWLLSAILVFACFDLGTPIAIEPQTLPPSPTSIFIPMDATLTPFPPLLPDSAITLTPVILPADTLVPTIIPPPTNTILPPLPDFNQLLDFGGGGGEGYDPCVDPMYPPPIVFAQRIPYAAHVARLCIYQIALPVGSPIHLTLTSPNGDLTILGDFQASGEFRGDGTLPAYWLGFENYVAYYYAVHCKEGSCSKWDLQFWWPANLPDGNWQIHLTWNGGEAFGIFETTPPLPELSVQDELTHSVLRPNGEANKCHPIVSMAELMVAGRGFPANTIVYIPVFEEALGTEYYYLTAQIMVSDGNGMVYGALTGPFQSGKRYVLMGVTDAMLPLIAPNARGTITVGKLKEDSDCFIAP